MAAFPFPNLREMGLLPMIKADPVFLFLLAILLVVAFLKDYFSFRIPNWLTYPALVVGISYFTITKGSEGFLFSLSGIAMGFALLFLPYLFGGTGAGDVKLLGAIGSFLGPKAVFQVFIISCILGGVYALFLLARNGLLSGTFRRYGIIVKGFIITQQFAYIPPTQEEKKIKVRFGLAMAVGTFSYLFFR
jgi:prepilin peptidase CpaA